MFKIITGSNKSCLQVENDLYSHVGTTWLKFQTFSWYPKTQKFISICGILQEAETRG